MTRAIKKGFVVLVAESRLSTTPFRLEAGKSATLNVCSVSPLPLVVVVMRMCGAFVPTPLVSFKKVTI